MVFVFSIVLRPPYGDIMKYVQEVTAVRTSCSGGLGRVVQLWFSSVQSDRAMCECALSVVRRLSLWCEVCNQGVIFLLGLRVLAAEYNLVDPAMSI